MFVWIINGELDLLVFLIMLVIFMLFIRKKEARRITITLRDAEEFFVYPQLKNSFVSRFFLKIFYLRKLDDVFSFSLIKNRVFNLNLFQLLFVTMQHSISNFLIDVKFSAYIYSQITREYFIVSENKHPRVALHFKWYYNMTSYKLKIT